MSNEAPPVETEDGLISRAQIAVSHCNWEVGECAGLWTKRYARGRTDADFATLVGLTADQVYQRRRVWETFGDVHGEYTNLRWSHFYSALNWDDAAECLQWANEIEATVAEMKAWRRAQRGEDLDEIGEDWVSDLAAGPSVVRMPDDYPANGGGSAGNGDPRAAGARDPQISQAARELGASGDDYAPFHDGAVQPVGGDSSGKSSEPPSPEQVYRRLAGTLERCAQMFTEELLSEWDEVPSKVRNRLVQALETLQDRASQIVG